MKANIVIVGGGIVGLTTALGFAQNDLEVILIDNHQIPKITTADKYDLRVSAINQASQRLFQNLRVWQKMDQNRISSFKKMFVWDHDSIGHIAFDADEINQSSLGHIIENSQIINALYQCLQEYPNVKMIYSNEPKSWQTREKDQLIILNDGQTVSTQLIIGADGANSWVRNYAEIPLDEKSYHQSALITTVKTTKNHQWTAWQCFLSDSVLAFLPLPKENQCSIVWSMDDSLVSEVRHWNAPRLGKELTLIFGATLGEVEVIDQFAVFPLTMRHAKHYVKPGLAIVGDAAHTIHPLAGQGVNLGLMDAAVLLEVVMDAINEGKSFTDYFILRRYELWRKGENKMMVTTMSLFKESFGSQKKPLMLLRNLGLQFVNRFKPLKNFFIRRAMGLEGDLPKLSR